MSVTKYGHLVARIALGIVLMNGALFVTRPAVRAAAAAPVVKEQNVSVSPAPAAAFTATSSPQPGTVIQDSGMGSLSSPTCTDPHSCNPVVAIASSWRCNTPECTGSDWPGAVINWPSWSAYHYNARTGNNSRSVFSTSGEKLYPYMGSWADGCQVTVVSGHVLIIEWQRGIDLWRATHLTAGQSHTIDLIAPEDNAMIEAPDGNNAFTVSLANCMPQDIYATPTSLPTDPATPVDTPTATLTETPTFTATPEETATVTFTSTPSATGTFTETVTPSPTATQAPSSQPFYLSLLENQTVGGVAAADEDILNFNGKKWRMFFDGSDVGLGNTDLTAFSVIDSNSILMAFSTSITVDGISVTPQDIVRFDATTLGNSTAGTFRMYFDGSDVGLTTYGESLDSILLLPDQRLLVSTLGDPVVGGGLRGDEDVLAFSPASLGSLTRGRWTMYFDGSDAGLADKAGEDVDTLDVGPSGDLYLSTLGNFSVEGVSGADEDVFVCTPTSIGRLTACSYSPGLYFDGSTWDLAANDVDEFHLLLP